MVKYSINLFGNNMDCELHVEQEQVVIKFSKDQQKELKSYLYRTLDRYAGIAAGTLGLEEMLQKAVEIEKSLGGKMTEPTVKLPYEFMPETKEKLIEAAALQGVSATQLLIRIINDKYETEFGLK